MSAKVTPLGHDQEGWRSIDADGALHFRMRHDGGAVLCVVPRAVLLTLPGILAHERRGGHLQGLRAAPRPLRGDGQCEVRRGRAWNGEIVLDGDERRSSLADIFGAGESGRRRSPHAVDMNGCSGCSLDILTVIGRDQPAGPAYARFAFDHSLAHRPLPNTFSSRYSRSHGEITCMNVSNSACLMAR